MAEYIEKRGWFPGQSGSQTHGYERVVSLGQVLGCMWSSGPGPHPTSGQSEVFAQRKFGSCLHSNTQIEQEGQVSVLAGEGLLSPAEPGYQWPGSSQSKTTILSGPLAGPALAVVRAQPQGCGQEDALLAPMGHVPHQPPTPTAGCKANKPVPQAGKRQTPGAQSSSPCPAPFSRLCSEP